MATSKLLKPTNVTISIPEFTDQPDQRVNSNCIDKEADAINTLSEQITKVDGRVYKISIQPNGTKLLDSTADHQIVLLLGFLGGVGCVAILIRKFTTVIESAKNLLTFSNWESSNGLSISVEDGHIKLTSSRSATSYFTVVTGMS